MEEEFREVIITSTKDQLTEFKESLVWKDIVNELEGWKLGFQMEQDGIVEDAATNNPSTASVLMHLGDINGRKKAVDYMLGIVDMFIDILEAKNDSRRNQANRPSDGE